MSYTKLMTNIFTPYYSFINKEAKRQNKTKRDIIEDAIKSYMHERKKEQIKKSYKAMSEDTEYLNETKDGLVCDKCKLLYEIRDDIPIMLIDEAKPVEI